jgi:hypothetical protein
MGKNGKLDDESSDFLKSDEYQRENLANDGKTFKIN